MLFADRHRASMRQPWASLLPVFIRQYTDCNARRRTAHQLRAARISFLDWQAEASCFWAVSAPSTLDVSNTDLCSQSMATITTPVLNRPSTPSDRQHRLQHSSRTKQSNPSRPQAPCLEWSDLLLIHMLVSGLWDWHHYSAADTVVSLSLKLLSPARPILSIRR